MNGSLLERNSSNSETERRKGPLMRPELKNRNIGATPGRQLMSRSASVLPPLSLSTEFHLLVKTADALKVLGSPVSLDCVPVGLRNRLTAAVYAQLFEFDGDLTHGSAPLGVPQRHDNEGRPRAGDRLEAI